MSRGEGRVLVTGWFSFIHGEATAGDLMAGEVACGWLERAGRPYDVAFSPVFDKGVDLRTADPEDYTDVVFVCGPARGWQIEDLTERFSGCRLIGLDLSVTGPDAVPFDVLFERDGPGVAWPDLSFLSPPELLPVVGLILTHPQPEYGERSRHDEVHAAIKSAVYSRPLSVVPFDTRVDPTSEEFRSAAEVESLVARLDAVVTTRMHGLVHALRAGIPVLAVDSISGGAKVKSQAVAVGWPAILTADELSEDRLAEMLDYIFTGEARTTARACAARAANALRPVREGFFSTLRDGRE